MLQLESRAIHVCTVTTPARLTTEFSAMYVQTSQNPVSTGYNRFAHTTFATLLIHKLPLLFDLRSYHVTKFHIAHYLKLTPPSLISLAINPCYFSFGVYITLNIKVFWEVPLCCWGNGTERNRTEQNTTYSCNNTVSLPRTL